MKHTYTIILTAAAMAWALNCYAGETAAMTEQPAIENANNTTPQDENDGPEAELTTPTIAVSGTQLHITNAAGETLEVYNIAGTKVATYHIDTDDVTLNLSLNKGCYIVKVGKTVRKVALK